MSWWRDLWERIKRWIRVILELLARLFSGGGGTIEDDKCCYLARKDNECNWVFSKSNYTCPEGYHKTMWVCCEGTQQIACGECSESETSCWYGPWECSIWWYTGESC